jgi:hypothetical protein
MTRDTLKLFASHFSIPLCCMNLHFGGTEKQKIICHWKVNIQLIAYVKKRVLYGITSEI